METHPMQQEVELRAPSTFLATSSAMAKETKVSVPKGR